MKKISKILSLILSIVTVSCLFSSCSSADTRIDFIYPFGGDIVSFDPQIASTSDEFLIIENCFEGLVRVRDNGEIQSGVAESWNISDDGLTYTFDLKQGTKWRIKEESDITKLMGEDFNPDITANDFVFALRRACEPITNAPLFNSISNIQNASAVHQGKMDSSKLGVNAADDYTLVITLQSPDNSFMSTLSTAIAMPCNEDYFNATKGRYGLGLSHTMFNGQFYVSSILDASYVLKNNDLYNGAHPSVVTDITLNITDANSEIAKNLKSGYYDCAYISGIEYEKLNDDRITVLPYSNKTWSMVLNKNRQIFSNKDLRQAVCLSISDIDFSKYSYLTNATTITPPSCTVENTSADEAMGATVPTQNTQTAIELWRKGLEEEKFTSATLTVITTQQMQAITKELVQGIQGSIGKISSYGKNGKISFSLKLEVLSDSEFANAFTSGEYDLAMYCFSANTHNTLSYLEGIINGNYLSDSKTAHDALKKAQSAKPNDLSDACKAVEKAIVNDYCIHPVCFESSYYAQAKGVSGVDFHAGSGRVSFINAKRED